MAASRVFGMHFDGDGKYLKFDLDGSLNGTLVVTAKPGGVTAFFATRPIVSALRKRRVWSAVKAKQ